MEDEPIDDEAAGISLALGTHADQEQNQKQDEKDQHNPLKLHELARSILDDLVDLVLESVTEDEELFARAARQLNKR